MKNEIECRSERMCIHVGFYVIVHLIVRSEVASFSTSDGSFLYIRGGRWVSNRSGFWPVSSGTVLQIPIKRSLDLFWLMWWISYLGFQYDILVCQPSVWICHLLNL
jgi:hypothetical protein